MEVIESVLFFMAHEEDGLYLNVLRVLSLNT